MMLREQQAVVPVVVRREGFKLPFQVEFLKQFLSQPERNGHGERPKAAGCKGEIGLQQPLELEKGLVVERHIVHIIEPDAACLQAIPNGVPRKARVMLLAREPFFLRSADDVPIAQ